MTHREMIAQDLGEARPTLWDPLPFERTKEAIYERIDEIVRRHKIETEYELAPYIRLLSTFADPRRGK